MRSICGGCVVSIDYQDGVMNLHPFGLPYIIVTRRMDGDDLVWTYPRIEGEVRMHRICQLPAAASRVAREDLQ